MLKRGYLTIKYCSGDRNSTVITQQFNVNNINWTTKSNNLNKDKWANKTLQKFQKDYVIPIRWKCEPHKSGKTNIHFHKIASNHVPKTTFLNKVVLGTWFEVILWKCIFVFPDLWGSILFFPNFLTMKNHYFIVGNMRMAG